jgi:hypothetical protein
MAIRDFPHSRSDKALGQSHAIRCIHRKTFCGSSLDRRNCIPMPRDDPGGLRHGHRCRNNRDFLWNSPSSRMEEHLGPTSGDTYSATCPPCHLAPIPSLANSIFRCRTSTPKREANRQQGRNVRTRIPLIFVWLVFLIGWASYSLRQSDTTCLLKRIGIAGDYSVGKSAWCDYMAADGSLNLGHVLTHSAGVPLLTTLALVVAQSVVSRLRRRWLE